MPTKICQHCNHTLNQDDVFCEKCGAKYENISHVKYIPSEKCSSCGKDLIVGKKFCSGCGSAASIPTPSIKPALTGDSLNEKKSSDALVVFAVLAFIIGIVGLFLSLSYTSSNKGASASSNSANQFLQGIPYVWDSFTPGECRTFKSLYPQRSFECLTREKYESLCKAAASITENGVTYLAIYESRNNQDLARAGDMDDFGASWNDQYKKYPCRVHLSVSGLVKGTSTRLDLNGGVDQFIVNDKNKVLVHQASSMMYGD